MRSTFTSRRHMVRSVAFAVAPVLFIVGSTRAAILFEDVMYWRPGGVTEINPANPPLDALVKIQETVYDDAQGRALLTQQIANGVTHGNGGQVRLAGPFDLYAYSISNLTYDNGASGVGNGVSGFHIPNVANVPYTMYGPNAANDYWSEDTQPGTAYSWDINANQNGILGDGRGILLGQTFNSFYYVVPAGTPHGFIPNTSINTYTPGTGRAAPMPIDFIFGSVSGPVPEPASGAAALVAIAAIRLRKR